MRHIIFSLMALALITACGSSEDILPTYGGVEITCAEATASSDGACDAVKVGTLSTYGTLSTQAVISNVPTSIFNSGAILNTTDIVNTDLEATNYGITNARVYLYVDWATVSGCEASGGATYTPTFDVDALSTTSLGSTGVGLDICANTGDVYYTVTMYNGLHMLEGVIPPDPLSGEPLHQAIVNFTYQ